MFLRSKNEWLDHRDELIVVCVAVLFTLMVVPALLGVL